MTDYEVALVDWSGRRWDLTNGTEGVLLLADGPVELKTRRSTEGARLAGVPGQVVRRGASLVEPVTATLNFVLCPSAADTSMAELWPAWHEAWNFDVPGRLEYRVGDKPARWVEVRLGDEGIDQPGRSPLGQEMVAVDVPVVSDSGLWFESRSTTGNKVTVTNNGVCPVWPRIRWKGAGGALTLPSGGALTLPASSTERVLYLDPVESGVVVDTAGSVDERLWASVRSHFVTEPVPVGQTRVYQLPDGARAEWECGYNTPWVKP